MEVTGGYLLIAITTFGVFIIGTIIHMQRQLLNAMHDMERRLGDKIGNVNTNLVRVETVQTEHEKRIAALEPRTT